MKRKTLPIAHYLLPRLQDVLFLSILLAVMLLGPRLFNIDGDLGRHLTTGKYMLQNRTIPTRDIFSHTMAGAPLTPHEWLAEVLFAAAYLILGLNGVVLLAALIIAITFVVIYRDALGRSSLRLTALGLTIWAAAASSLHWLARPHLFTFLFLALWAERLEQVRRGERVSMWQFPALMLLWANTHGAFIAGFVTWGIYLIGWLWDQQGKRRVTDHLGQRLALIGGLSFLATLFNPSGWRLWITSLGYIQNRFLVSHTAEYFSPDFHQAGTWPFLLLIAFALLLLSRARVRLPATHSLLLAGWAAMALYSTRNIPLFAIITPPILAEAIQASTKESAKASRLENRLQNIEQTLGGFLWPALSVLLAFLLTINPILSRRNQFEAAIFPVQAVDWLEEHPQHGNMFNYFTWGGYLLYRLWPEQGVFIDGQTDFYGEALTRQYEQVITLRKGWEDILGRYGVQWVILPVESDLAEHLRTDPGWKVLYSDATAILLRRH